MQRHKLFYSLVVLLGLASFVSCFTAEFKKSKMEDVRWDGERNCYVQESEAFGLGTAAVLCLGLAQLVGNIIMYRNHQTRRKTEDGYKTPTLTTVLLLMSWVSFVVVVVLVSTATSMSRRQAYGEGWLEEECYVVKDGVFAASGCLVLLTLGALTVAAAKTREHKRVDQLGATEDGTRNTQNQEPREEPPPKKKSETVVSVVEEANSTTDLSRI